MTGDGKLTLFHEKPGASKFKALLKHGFPSLFQAKNLDQLKTSECSEQARYDKCHLEPKTLNLVTIWTQQSPSLYHGRSLKANLSADEIFPAFLHPTGKQLPLCSCCESNV